jgi:hypothetical protein
MIKATNLAPRARRHHGTSTPSTPVAAGMLEAETRFRKVEGYRGLAQLAIPHRNRPHQTPPPPQRGLVCV